MLAGVGPSDLARDEAGPTIRERVVVGTVAGPDRVGEGRVDAMEGHGRPVLVSHQPPPQP